MSHNNVRMPRRGAAPVHMAACCMCYRRAWLSTSAVVGYRRVWGRDGARPGHGRVILDTRSKAVAFVLHFAFY